MRFWIALAAVAVLIPSVASAKEDPVQWTISPKTATVAPGAKAYFNLTANIQPGWHLYSPTTPPGGPNPTKISLIENPAFSKWSVYRPKPVRKFDANFNIDTETYTGSAVFLIEALTASSSAGVIPTSVTARYQACTDVSCLPPVKKTVTAQLTVTSGSPATSQTIPSNYDLVSDQPQPAPTATNASSAPIPQNQQALLPFLLTAFGFGLAAIFTPCVFPMIPITVSFFVGQGNEKSAWTKALVFLPRNHRPLHSPGLPGNRHRRTLRRSPTRLQPMGKRLHRHRLLHLRPQPARSIRTHPTLRPVD